jgi:hypothetical protein
MTSKDFLELSDAEVKQRVDELRIGNQTLKQSLVDVPGGLSMLEGYVLELKQEEGLAVLSKVKANGHGIQEIKETLKDDSAKLTDYANRLGKKLDNAENALIDIKDSTDKLRVAMTAVTDDVKGNGRALSDLAEITYMGWSTEQRLAAMQSDLFPNIKGKARDDLVTQLKAESAQEHSVAALNDISENVGNLAKIAGNLGIDSDLATGLQGAQIVVQGITGFVTGNPLAAMATLSSLTSLGKPDPTMAALAAIDKKLTVIIELQQKTLKAIGDLSDQMVKFHKEEMEALNRIEETVLINNALLQAIALRDWESCDALLSNSAEINDMKTLTAILDDGQSTSRFQKCYDTYVDSLDAKFKSGDWAAQRLDMITFPAENVVAIPEYQKQIRNLADAKLTPYAKVRAYLLLKLAAASTSGHLEESLIRLAQPVTTVRGSVSLSNALSSPSVHARLSQFKCGDNSILHDGLRAVLCYHARDDAPPDPNQWPKVINETLLGPQAYRMIDDGLQVALLSDFFIRPASVHRDVFVHSDDVEAAKTKGMSKDMQEALNEGKGLSLLRRLQWIGDALVLQESMLSGSYTSDLLEAELYDRTTHALKSDVAIEQQRAALDSMRANPILARNTVMLAMRHAIRDSLGNEAEATKYGYLRGTYHMAIADFGSGDGCSGIESDRAGLRALFPGWSFEYRVTKEDTDEDSTLNTCVAADNDQRRGLYVKVGDVVIAAPSPLALAAGSYEVSEGLRRSAFVA